MLHLDRLRHGLCARIGSNTGLAVTLAALTVGVGFVPASAQGLQTAAEISGFTEYTTHDEMWDYLLAVRASSTDMLLSSYGETREGRELPYAIFGRPRITQPWEASLLGRPIVMFNANVHGGERTLRESLLILIRQLATRGTPENEWLDDLVILVAPQINPDGFHADGGATRGNAWGIDLNRDYVKLEHPEIASYVGQLINTWHPHLFVDGHNGGSWPYNINYQCPSHASPDQRITEFCDFTLLPFIDESMEDNGYKSWYYTGGNETRWNTGGFQARIGRNYGGFINAVGILFESPGGQGMQIGVSSGLVAFKSVLEYVSEHPDEVMDLVNRARLETLQMGLAAEGEVVVDMEYGPEDRRVTYEIDAEQGDERVAIEITSDSLMKKPIPLATRPRPYAYILPRDAVDAVAMLRRHNITVEQLQEETTLEVQAYTVGAVDHSRQYNHAAVVELTVGEVVTVEQDFPRGTYVVPTGQVLGRLVTHMLEPETDDNVLYWNTLDAFLPRPGAATDEPDEPEDEPPGARAGGRGGAAGGGRGGRGGRGGGRGGRGGGPPLVPIFKLMTPTPLATRIIQ